MKAHFVRMLAAAIAIVATSGAPATAQEYPQQPIRLIVPYPPGGSTDFVARLYADRLSKELGQTVIIDNRPGASTNIGSDAVAKAKPDGYTVLFGGGTAIINSIFGPMPPFDPMTALDPVSLVARVPFVLAANPKTSFSSAKELFAAAKSSPGKFTVSSAQLDLYVELMKHRSEMNVLHIPYKGGAAATTDAISGQVDMVYALGPVLLPQIQSGKLKALAVTSGKRVHVLNEVPTFTESGVDYDLTIWYALMAPAGTPKSIITRLARATQNIATQADYVQKLRVSGVEPVSNQPEELSALMRSDLALWQNLAKTVPSLKRNSENK